MLVVGMAEALSVSYFLGYRDYYIWTLEYGAFLGFSFAVFVISENFLTLTYENKTISHFAFFTDAILQNSARTIGRIIYFLLFYAAFHVVLLRDFQFQFLAGLNFSVLIELYFVGLFIFTTWCSGLLIVETSITVNLPPIESDESHLLAVGDFLSSNKSDGLVYHLILSRLADTVAKDAKTRDQIFNITNISGKVVMWEEVCSKCLATLKVFLEGLNKANKELTSHTPSFLSFSRPFNYYHVEDNSFSKCCSDHQKFSTYLNTILNKMSTTLLRLPFIRLLMREIPYASTWRLFSSGGTNRVASVWTCDESSHQTGQAVIWTTEVIGILALSSYVEDRLGAVQQSLGQILSVIDEIIEAVEMHFKFVGLTPPTGGLFSAKMNKYRQVAEHTTTVIDNSTPSVQTYRYASDANLPWRIHSTLRWALVSCLKRFGQHLKTLHMDPKRRTKLEHLMKTLDAQKEDH
nr:nucleoporin NDC1 [Hymenolepis microstoma]